MPARSPLVWRGFPELRRGFPELGPPEGDERPCVVHLVRAANGLAPLRAFAEAWRRHRPGVDHRLVLALKGFRSPAEAREHLDQLADLEPEPIFVPDTGLDLGTYLVVAARLRRDRYCFLNSFSEPLVDGWLAKLDAALCRPGAGVVGASGSWTSSRSWIAYSLGLPSAYRGLLPPPAVVRGQMRELMSDQPSSSRSPRREVLRARLLVARQVVEHDRFPERSLRTNAFMVSHATLGLLRLGRIRHRADSLAVESGRSSMTRRVQALGMRALVVDRNGGAYEPDRWDRSCTFWQGNQEGLLVADNRTRIYDDADLVLRRTLAGLTWGSCARPSAREPRIGDSAQTVATANEP